MQKFGSMVESQIHRPPKMNDSLLTLGPYCPCSYDPITDNLIGLVSRITFCQLFAWGANDLHICDKDLKPIEMQEINSLSQSNVQNLSLVATFCRETPIP